MPIYKEHDRRFGARERLQEDPGEEPAHHLLRPLCAQPDPPKRAQIKRLSPHQHIPQGNHREPSIPQRNLAGEGSGRESTGDGGWTEQTEPAREEGERNGHELWFPLSLRYPSPPAAKNTGNALEWHAEREGRRRGEHVRGAVSSHTLTNPRLPLSLLSCSSSTMGVTFL